MPRDAIGVVRRHYDGPDDVVDARAQPAAGHDGAFRLARIEVNPVAGARQLKGHGARRGAFVHQLLVHGEDHAPLARRRQIARQRESISGVPRL